MEKSTFVLSVSTSRCTDRRITEKRAPAVITLPDLVLIEGKNRIVLPVNKGYMEFVKQGDQFSEMVLTDMVGYATCLSPMATEFAVFSSEAIVPDACFGLPDSGEMALCFCKTAATCYGTYTVIIRKAVLYAL